MRLEVRHLRVLGAIAEHGSLTRAAAWLGVSQPALSAQLHRIEHLLGGEVFARGRRGAEPTPFGEFVLTRVRGALSNIDDLVRERPRNGAVARLGAIESCMLVGLLTGMDDLMAESGTSVRTEYSTRLLLDLVETDRLDGALLADYPGHEVRAVPGVRHETLVREPVFVALPSHHRLAGAPSVALADLAEDPWVVQPSDGTGWPEYFLAACERSGFQPRTRHQIVENHLQRAMIRAGRAVALVQPTFQPSEGIAVRPLTGDPLWMRHLFAWRVEGGLAALAPALVELVLLAYEAGAARCPAYLAWRATRPG